MNNNEIMNFGYLTDLMNEGLDETKNLVIRDRDNTTTWVDVDDDPKAKLAMEAGKCLVTVGFTTMNNWDEIGDHFPQSIREQIDNEVHNFIEILIKLQEYDEE